MIRVHIISEDDHVRIVSMEQVPRPGDEIRLSDDHFVEVTKVVWCLDEPSQRANVGVKEVS